MTIGTTRSIGFCRRLIVGVFLITGAYWPARAQVLLDMSLLKCSDYLQAAPDRQELIAAWMSGYFNASRNQPIVDLSRFATNKKLVEKYCKQRKRANENLMNAIQKAAF
jgi:acid stress chaperone HdeB